MNNETEHRGERRRKRGGGSVRIPVMFCILIIAVLAAVALILPVFDVTEVYCVGNSAVKYEDIMNAARIDTGKNIFLENLGGAKRRIEDIPKVKSAELKRIFPNRICITVVEREAYAYIPADGGYALVAEDGTVIEMPGGDASMQIGQAKIPTFDSGDENEEDKPSDTQDSKNSDSSDNEKSDNEKSAAASGENGGSSEGGKSANDENSEGGSENNSDGSEQGTEIASVPVAIGAELKNAAEGKKAEADNADKLAKIFELCRGLSGAELLNRTTYINVENTEDIRLVIENRLEVLLGKAENIDYRCKFLAEVINTKISATESVILDYRGDDIYAENRDDGKERVDKSVRKKSENKNNTEKSTDITDTTDTTDTEDAQKKNNTDTNDTTNKNTNANNSESEDDGGEADSGKSKSYSADLSDMEDE